jgi:hypothetical protein
MNKLTALSMDCNLDRRTVLKFRAGISAFAAVSRVTVSAAVLASDGEIAALTARAAADYMRRGELKAERYAQVLLDKYKAHTNLNTVTYIDEVRYWRTLARSTEPAREARNWARWLACRFIGTPNSAAERRPVACGLFSLSLRGAICGRALASPRRQCGGGRGERPDRALERRVAELENVRDGHSSSSE